ncbi:hypothetical protein BDA99DRAFT_566355 [Phascolomyces articulosus]|uniref:Uncharacterized protein n=1 Tax=Phascolomyces articulosus TaxID=60185 RepID=A0AAD5JLP6_9FUNG|nr:hypothetical protein BDA99DRAFT_566355 [Phascolomyces articulosus]
MLERTITGETKLWSSVFDPILSFILSDSDKNIVSHWSNVIPSEGSSSELLQVHSDALICQDIIRLAILGKKALVDSKLNAVIMLQIHGYHISAYISKLIPSTTITAIIQVLEIQFSQSVQEVDSR